MVWRFQDREGVDSRIGRHPSWCRGLVYVDWARFSLWGHIIKGYYGDMGVQTDDKLYAATFLIILSFGCILAVTFQDVAYVTLAVERFT